MSELAARDALKRAAAGAAVAEVRAGMVVGLGTGTTAAFAIAALGARCRDGLIVSGVATSLATEAAARAAGIPMIDFADMDAIDLAIDGVDEIDPALRAIKGHGGAMLREKIVATAAARMIAIADVSKRVERLGAAPVPVEVLPFARSFVARAIGGTGGQARLRTDASGTPVHSDQGNIILDCAFPIDDPAYLARRLAAIPGVLGHGLFPGEIDRLYLATPSGVVAYDRTDPPHDGRTGPPGSKSAIDRFPTAPAEKV